MRTTPNLSLTVWNTPQDEFDPDELAANWDKIDADATTTRPTDRAEAFAALPVIGNFDGRLVYLTAADGGFQAKTLVRFDGSSWNAIGPFEKHNSLPTLGNFIGRVIVITSASGGFQANDVLVNTDGANSWRKVGGIASGITLPGSPTAGDLFLLTGADGGFEAYSLVAYTGSAWVRTEKRGVEVLSALPVSPYLGQVIVLSTIVSPFAAWDLVRWDGAVWGRIGPIPTSQFPGYRWDYKQSTSDITGITANTEGAANTILVGNSTTYDGTQVKVEFFAPAGNMVAGNGSTDLRGVFLRDTTVIGQVTLMGNRNNWSSIYVATYDTPSAGIHIYTLKAFAPTSGQSYTVTAGSGVSGERVPAYLRVSKAG